MKWLLGKNLSEYVGGKTAAALEREFGISRVLDLLMHYPRRYLCRGSLTPFSELMPGAEVTILGEVLKINQRRTANGTNLLDVRLSDGADNVQLVFFNQAWRAEHLKPGARGLFAGRVVEYRGQKQLSHPDYELFSSRPTEAEIEKWEKQLIPIYPACASLSSWKIAQAIGLVLAQIQGQPIDPVPESDREIYGLLNLDQALQIIHQPEEEAALEKARDTLRFFEAFLLQNVLLRQKRLRKQRGAPIFEHEPGGWLERAMARLTFSPTRDQLAAAEEIFKDLAGGEPMNRLLQGEVGSGKTLVAFQAMLRAADNGCQSVLVAPTEILAKQHYQGLLRLLGPELTAEIMPSLLLGGQKKPLLRIASGGSKIVIGTHAVFGKEVVFDRLGLIVIDEQQRFGVEQREELMAKGASPHLLMLSATPIPRTAALSLLNFLDISTIKEMPAGRAEVQTFVVPLAEKPKWRQEVIRRVAQEVQAGHQVFVVAPVIGENKIGAESVDIVLEELEAAPLLRDARISRLHGNLSAADAEKSMEEFAAGQSDVLVSTTMVEVGVDVPNATAMVITSADRFGIAQLHQLRGRIGRGKLPGICLLVTNSPLGSVARERLDMVAQTRDGFVLAEADLKIRREGELLGFEQSGRVQRRLLQLDVHGKILEKAKESAEKILQIDPSLERHPLIKAMMAENLTRGELDRLLSG